MKKIRKTAVNKITNILESAKKINVYTQKNNYLGENITISPKDIKITVEDIKEGCASIFEVKPNQYKIQYAEECFWEITTTGKNN